MSVSVMKLIAAVKCVRSGTGTMEKVAKWMGTHILRRHSSARRVSSRAQLACPTTGFDREGEEASKLTTRRAASPRGTRSCTVAWPRR